jgi:hypothetical protein
MTNKFLRNAFLIFMDLTDRFTERHSYRGEETVSLSVRNMAANHRLDHVVKREWQIEIRPSKAKSALSIGRYASATRAITQGCRSERLMRKPGELARSEQHKRAYRLRRKRSSISQIVKLPDRIFLFFQKPFFSCFDSIFEDNDFAFLTSFFLRLPAVSFFDKVCCSTRSVPSIGASVVRFLEQTPGTRRLGNDRCCQPFAVSSCLDVPAVRRRRVVGVVVQGLFAVDELPPELTPKARLGNSFGCHSSQVGVCLRDVRFEGVRCL